MKTRCLKPTLALRIIDISVMSGQAIYRVRFSVYLSVFSDGSNKL